MEGHIASPEEVRQAIESLTEVDYLRLNAYARNRIARLGSLAGSHGADDLLQEAMLSLLEEGRRYWRPERVSLTDFLMGTMRSIGSNWARKGARGDAPLHGADLMPQSEEQDDSGDFFDTIPGQGPDPEMQLVNNECQTLENLIQEIEGLVEDDLTASVVLDEMKAGKKGPDIMKALGITEKELRAAQRIIQRRVRARWGGLPHVR